MFGRKCVQLHHLLSVCRSEFGAVVSECEHFLGQANIFPMRFAQRKRLQIDIESKIVEHVIRIKSHLCGEKQNR